MGCFSYKCLECGRGVLSSSFTGDHVHLFLLIKGKVVQQMTGEYDSYGRVFIDGTQDPDVKHPLRLSQDWKNPTTGIVDDEAWSTICGLNKYVSCHTDINSIDFDNGIAAIHTKCFKKLPVICSPRDPNQGWSRSKKIKNYNPLVDHWKDIYSEMIFHINNEIEIKTAILPFDKHGFYKQDLKNYSNKSEQLMIKMKSLNIDIEELND